MVRNLKNGVITPVLYEFLRSRSPKAILYTVLRKDVTNGTFPVCCPLVQRRLGLMQSASTPAPSSETLLLLAMDYGGFVEGKRNKGAHAAS